MTSGELPRSTEEKDIEEIPKSPEEKPKPTENQLEWWRQARIAVVDDSKMYRDLIIESFKIKLNSDDLVIHEFGSVKKL